VANTALRVRDYAPDLEAWLDHVTFNADLASNNAGETLFGNLVAAITARAPELGDAN
jgi:hypothetical protein